MANQGSDWNQRITPCNTNSFKKIPNVEERLFSIEANQKKYEAQVHLLTLFMMKTITPKEFGRLSEMMRSPDLENHVMAIETINNLFKT